MDNTDNKNPVKLEISQDKLVDFLFHAATREDIAALRNEVKKDIENLDNKLTEHINHHFEESKQPMINLETRMDQRFEESRQSMSHLDNHMNHQFEESRYAAVSFEARMDRRFHKIDGRYNWIVGMIITSLLTVVGILAHGFHWF